MNEELLANLKKQNRLLKQGFGLLASTLVILLFVAAHQHSEGSRFTEIDVERINILGPDGKMQAVISNSVRLPKPIIAGKTVASDRQDMPGLLFYNQTGGECGGLIYRGKLDLKGKADAGMHFSMDRFQGDQQLALGHYEEDGKMSTGLNIYDRGLFHPLGWICFWSLLLKTGPELTALVVLTGISRWFCGP